MKISDALLSDLKSLVSSVEVELKTVVLLAHSPWLRDIADKLEDEVHNFERPPIPASEAKP